MRGRPGPVRRRTARLRRRCRWGDWCRARDPTWRSPRSGQAPETELVLAGGSASGALPRNPGSEWPAGCGWQVRCAGTTCLRCCVRRTRCCARLGTSRSGRFRWKQWPMAVGGLTDTVVDGITGRLVPPRDPARLAAQLRALPDVPQSWRRWGPRSRSGSGRGVRGIGSRRETVREGSAAGGVRMGGAVMPGAAERERHRRQNPVRGSTGCRHEQHPVVQRWHRKACVRPKARAGPVRWGR
ncbi:hypothetical protein SAMN05421854_120140 [Amycolatopsis rubida]|uniref:Uncharacterized protein n=1 Tax=Amycolatopsis rubida TaxID=112413 RepID=A0A1I6ASQ4_9PSEU|nr:hypothetical protein SAMN05421854_120140 [Amycolatopsis rubida]